MPLEQRLISPISVGRGCVPMDSAGNLAINIPNELECVTNGTLANIIRQLSSLSRFAEDLFGSILRDATTLIARASTLQQRIERLGQKVSHLDSSVEEVSLQDIHLRKAFKSCQIFDQQVVARDTIPEAIREVYFRCDKPPPLQKLNAYRDDGKDGLKFYTDPNYFFDLWRQEMLADTEKVLADKVRKLPKNKQQGSEGKRARKPRAPANSRERYRQMMANQGEFIIETKGGVGGEGVQPNQMIYIDTNGAIVDPNQVIGGMVVEGGGAEGLQRIRPNSLELNQSVNAFHHSYVAPNHVNGRGVGVGMVGPNVQQMSANYYQKYREEVQQMNQMNQMYNTSQHVNNYDVTRTPTRRQASIASRPSQPPPAPPSGGSAPSSGPTTPSHTMTRNSDSNHVVTEPALQPMTTPTHSSSRPRTRDTLPPPPPPPQEFQQMNGQQESHKQSPIGQNVAEEVKREPPPPPPPPPSLAMNSNNANMTSDVTTHRPTISDLKTITLRKTPVTQPVAKSDARSDLLAAIREGIQLKRVEDCKQREVEKSTPLHDVASILARRVAIELSDSEGGAEEDDSDGDWDDESEC